MSLKTVPTQVKYGLVKKSQSNNQKLNAPVRKIGIFKDDLEEDDEDGINNDIDRVNLQLRKRNNLGMEKLAAAPTDDIYDYDGAYDSFKAAEVTSHPLSRASSAEQPKSRYISSLLTTAKMREREADRVYEKNVIKERKVEDEQFADQPKFITKAYRDKLIEDQKWEYENRLADQLEQKTDVRKSGMQGFYANLLTKNISMGGDVDTNALSAYTAGSVRQTHVAGQDELILKPQAAVRGGKGSETEPVERSNKVNHKDSHQEHVSVASQETYVATATEESSEVIRETQPVPPIAKIIPPPVSTQKDEEQLMSAKERYLARKRKAEDSAKV